MLKRRRFNHALSLHDRLASFAEIPELSLR